MRRRNLHTNQNEGYHAAVPKSKLPTRPWPITFGGLLIILQGLVFLFISVGALLVIANYSVIVELLRGVIPPTELPLQVLDPLGFMPSLFIEATLGLTFALFLLLNGLRFLQRHPRAWLVGMVLQGMNLLTALVLYWRGSRGLVFIWMLASLVIVFHLNRAEVLSAFHLRVPEVEKRE